MHGQRATDRVTTRTGNMMTGSYAADSIPTIEKHSATERIPGGSNFQLKGRIWFGGIATPQKQVDRPPRGTADQSSFPVER